MTKKEISTSRVADSAASQIETIEAVRSQLVDAALFALAIIGFLAVIASLLRILDVGWQHVMFLHIGFYLVVLGTAILYRRLSFHVRAFVVLGILFFAGIGGLLTWGLIGMGSFFFVTCSILAAIFLGTRAGIIALAASLVVIAAIGIGVHLGSVVFHFNIDIYAIALSSWIVGTVGVGFFTAIIVASLGKFQNSLVHAIRTLHKRTSELQHTNDRLTQEIVERERIENALKESEEKFSKVFHLSPDALVISRLRDGLFLDVNKGFTEMTGYTEEDITGKTAFDIDIWVNPAVRSQLQIIFQEKDSANMW